MEGVMEKNMTSSMTSVTEEETSSAGSESDTTESYTSNITSSALSSTDYNTDDKLTPGLNNIKISKTHCGHHSYLNGNNNSFESVSENCFINQEPHGTYTVPDSVFNGPKPMETDVRTTKAKKSLLKTALVHHSSKSGNNINTSGLTDSEYKTETDVSDTSTRPDAVSNETEEASNATDSESGAGGTSVDWTTDSEASSASDSSRPFLPDMRSSHWYRAQCFDHYWSTYQFAMDWYKQHMQAVVNLVAGQPEGGVPRGRAGSMGSIRSLRGKRSRKARKSSRAKERRLSKSRQKGTKPDGDQSDIEMEISDEMMAFFATSMKHRMKRDQEKDEKEEVKIDTLNPFHVPSPTMSPPKEQPGVRRSSEMYSLYGKGSAMVQGMETALQMTFDRITDLHQPKLWPNMPLNVVFQKSGEELSQKSSS